jgi:hypothetical protein
MMNCIHTTVCRTNISSQQIVLYGCSSANCTIRNALLMRCMKACIWCSPYNVGGADECGVGHATDSPVEPDLLIRSAVLVYL